MIRSDGIPSANADGLIMKLSTLGDPDSPVWQETILANLRAAAGAQSGETAFALVDRLVGHLGWEPARKVWSWLLDVVPSLTIVFLTRNHVRTLASMETGGWRVWIPRYGNCASWCERNLANHLEAIDRYAEERPDRCIRVDADDLLSFTAKPSWISEEAWAREITEKTHTVDSLVELPEDPEWAGWDESKAMMLDLPEPAPPQEVKPPRVFRLQADQADTAASLEVHAWWSDEESWMVPCSAALNEWCDRHGYELALHAEACSPVVMLRQFLGGDAEMMLMVTPEIHPHPQAPGFPKLPGMAVSHGVVSLDRASASVVVEKIADEECDPYEWEEIARGNGVELSDLPDQWNRYSRAGKRPLSAAWFFRLGGSDRTKALKKLRKQRLLPPPPKAFECPPETGIERAICYPWIAKHAKWEELRYSIRSVEKNFADRECPIFILGPDRPRWLTEHPRVKHIFIDYSQGRTRGLYEANRIGLTIAQTVLWMNDDEILVKPCGWDSFGHALTEGRLDEAVDSLLDHGNKWRAGMANAVVDLRHHGFEGPVMRFATHTPFLFEREKSIEIFTRFRLPFKGGWANLYHNWHRTPHKPCGKVKTHSLGKRRIWPETLFLNYKDSTLRASLKRQIEEAFPEPAPWESDSPESVLLPDFGTGAVVWPWKADLAEWDELWFSVQSVKKHFSEKDWKHVLFADLRPDWWEGEFIKAESYVDALYAGMQCADRVLWMNDDIILIDDQGPEDFALAREGRALNPEDLVVSENTWEQMLGGMMMTLESRGLRTTNFETHIPYLFERGKVRATFEVFPPRYKMPFATVYHNLHATDSIPLTEKARNPAEMDGKLWVNPQHRQLTEEFMLELVERFGSPPVTVL